MPSAFNLSIKKPCSKLSQALEKSISIIQTKFDLSEVECEFVNPHKRLFRYLFHILSQLIANYFVNFDIKGETKHNCSFTLVCILKVQESEKFCPFLSIYIQRANAKGPTRL